RLAEQVDRIASGERRVVRGEEGADVLHPGRAEHGIGERVRQHVAVGVAGEAARMLDANAAEYERHAVLERMRVEARADPVIRHSHDAIFARSSAVVTLRSSGSPGTTLTRPPEDSTSPAQSVASAPLATARRRTSAGKACGVCTA